MILPMILRGGTMIKENRLYFNELETMQHISVDIDTIAIVARRDNSIGDCYIIYLDNDKQQHKALISPDIYNELIKYANEPK